MSIPPPQTILSRISSSKSKPDTNKAQVSENTLMGSSSPWRWEGRSPQVSPGPISGPMKDPWIDGKPMVRVGMVARDGMWSVDILCCPDDETKKLKKKTVEFGMI